MLERVAPEPHTRLRYFCSPQHTDSALYPIISQMERAVGLAQDVTAQVKLDKLDALLAQSFTPPQDAALFAEMLSLPNDGRYPTLELAPQQRRQKTLEALTTQMEALSRSNPLLMIFEDVHWIDPTSLEVLGRAVDRIKTLGVLLIVTYRPEFEPPWFGRPHVTALTVNRLGEREIAAMIDRVIGNMSLPASIRHDIIERTDGIPLFVEEMTKAVVEAEGEGRARQMAAGIPSSALAVPASLHASLMARLDRLGSAKEIAQIAAAIGREFSHALLAAVVRKPETELVSALDRLVEAGLLFRQGVAPHATYLFKHALVQDAAYGTLLREPRRALHARIAEVIENQFTEITENQPELLAQHYTEAGQIEKAALLWGKAGQRSLERSALVEAVAQLTRALDQIATLPMTPDLRREEIKVQVTLITPLIYVKGYASPETKQAAERARQLIEEADARGEPPEDPLLLFSVLYGFWVVNTLALKGEISREIAEQFLNLAMKQDAVAPRMMGHRLMGHSLLLTGDPVRGRAHYDEGIRLYDPAQHQSLATRFGQDIRVSMFGYRSLAVWILGYPEAAIGDAENALTYARQISQAPTIMFALAVGVWARTFCGRLANAQAILDELLALTDEKGAPYFKATGLMYQGMLLALTGDHEEAVQVITTGINASRATGATLWTPLFLSYLAISHATLGQFDASWRSLNEAVAAMEGTKEGWFEAEINRMAGEIALMSPKLSPVNAEEYFERALIAARKQQAKSWELRASMSMARLWRDQAKRDEARNLLAPIYGWFTEGFDTLDLKEAKALLGELAS